MLFLHPWLCGKNSHSDVLIVLKDDLDEDARDDEYVPPAIILDADVDYDEYDERDQVSITFNSLSQ